MMRTTTTLLLAIVLLASCNQYQKTPSGLSYKITKGTGKEKLRQGEFVKFNVEYKVPPKDSILTSSFGHIPAYIVVDTTKVNKHSFLEILTKLAVGDKVEFVMSVDSLKNLGMIEYNNVFRAKDMIKGRVEIIKAFNNQPDAMADLQKEQDLEKDREVKELQAYTTKQGIKTQSVASGVLVEITNAGDVQKADSGKQANILYKGSFIGGKEFDSNIGKAAPNNQPLPVVIGGNSVIKGLDDGLRLFGKGGKGRVFIPAMLGYGQNGYPPTIPGYANLVFEIEVVDITVPAPKPVQPFGPNGQPQNPAH